MTFSLFLSIIAVLMSVSSLLLSVKVFRNAKENRLNDKMKELRETILEAKVTASLCLIGMKQRLKIFNSLDVDTLGQFLNANNIDIHYDLTKNTKESMDSVNEQVETLQQIYNRIDELDNLFYVIDRYNGKVTEKQIQDTILDSKAIKMYFEEVYSHIPLSVERITEIEGIYRKIEDAIMNEEETKQRFAEYCINVYLSKLAELGKIELEQVKCYVEFDKSKTLDKGFGGSTTIDNNGIPVVYLSPQLTLKGVMEATSHEAVHVMQICKGDMTPGFGYTIWKGEKYKSLPFDHPEYFKKQPWEKEARELESILLKHLQSEVNSINSQ